MDNFLRPVRLHNRMHIHLLLIFFSMLGGWQLFKFDGIVLEALFGILLFTLIDIARTEDSME